MIPEKPYAPKGPYMLQSGIYKGKSLEQLPFLPGFKIRGIYRSGYDYLVWVIENHRDPELVKHAKLVKMACDEKKPVVSCQCGQHRALYEWVSTNESGSTISFSESARYGEECKYVADIVDAKLIELNFRSIASFRSGERERFINLLKYCLLGRWDVKITAKLAFNYLFGEVQLGLFKT